MFKITKITAFFCVFQLILVLQGFAIVGGITGGGPIGGVVGPITGIRLSCSSVGASQTKYTASGCDTETSTRTCCKDGFWSDWGTSCTGSQNCTSSQCWNGSSCTSKGTVSRACSGNVTNATGGTQTRTATCNKGSGWTYGVWTGTCTCKSTYTWNGSMCYKPSACSITSCPSGQHLINAGTSSCCCEYDTCETTQYGQAAPCKCINTGIPDIKLNTGI